MNCLVNDAQAAGWFPASIRTAPRIQQQQFLDGMPPISFRALIDRDQANMPDWYASWAQNFFQVTDDFIAHATKCAPCKRLPRGWEVATKGEFYERIIGFSKLSVRASDYGWLVELAHLLDPDEKVLTDIFLEAPLLCPTYAAAARLAEASFPKALPDIYRIGWWSRFPTNSPS
jgi:hypothetical protein